MVTGLCNVFINSEHKYQKLQETFPRVLEISDNWLIYFRGKYKKEAEAFVRTLPQATSRCTFFHDLTDTDWAGSTTHMLEQSRYEYVYTYLEDHFLLKPIDEFTATIKDMVDHSLDYFAYSFFNVGLNVHTSEIVHPEVTPHFYTFTYTEANHNLIADIGPTFYPYSLVSVASKKYLRALLTIERVKVIRVPYYLQAALDLCINWRAPRNLRMLFALNRWARPLRLRFTIYSPATPFNLEKSVVNFNPELWPIKIGILKEELFANWDDDHEIINSSLMKRGKYPLSLIAPAEQPVTEQCGTYTWEAGQKRDFQYFKNIHRLPTPPRKTIFVDKGTVVIRSEQESYTLKKGESLTVYANILHTIEAKTDVVFRMCIANN